MRDIVAFCDKATCMIEAIEECEHETVQIQSWENDGTSSVWAYPKATMCECGSTARWAFVENAG